jgi:superfamily II DNA or RNA helicase
MTLKLGIYEELISHSLKNAIEDTKNQNHDVATKKVDPGESHQIITRHMQRILVRALTDINAEDHIALYNNLLEIIQKHNARYNKSDMLLSPAERLLGVHDPMLPIHPRPDTPLSFGCLLTATSSDPSLVSQLQQEILNSDRVDILCSFIKWSGIRILRDELEEFTRRKHVRLRVITTSYLGATDFKAIEFLQSLPNTQLWVSYDTKRTRLHAKAYMFHRNSGFGTAYVGSSNLSNPALTSGLEWNVKISQYESEHLWKKICATFETYRNDREFVVYDKSQKDRLKQALNMERTARDTEDGGIILFDITPYHFQQEILDKLEADRKLHKRYRNLVVAATGTGKTIVAAFDYKRSVKEHRQDKLLFVAHREEILKQSRAIFRTIFRNQNFGELLVGNHEPDRLEQLFVSIQSFNARQLWDIIPPDFYDFIIVDEFHHAAAASYQRLLNHFRPKILLGLTATPERSDGLDIVKHFDNHITAEIRLPDAINRKLLCPFQYFGITDDTSIDLRNLTWSRGGYDQKELDKVFTGNDARAQLVIKKVREALLDVHQARGLCFCVSQKHATFMAKRFNHACIPADVLTAESSSHERDAAQKRLVERKINFICVVDLYNEGIDIPEIDTVLFLRPTESLIVFLQQLGRGLRFHDDKECLTVLDFVGQAHQRFNYEQRFRALTGRTSHRISKEIKKGFPHLPSGCVIKLEKYAQKYVLDNIRQNLLNITKSRFVQRIATFQNDTGCKLTLPAFLDYYGLGLYDVYKRGSWSRLCVEAGAKSDFFEPDEKPLSKGLRRIIHYDCAPQLERLLNILKGDLESINKLQHVEDERLLTMLTLSIWGQNLRFKSLSEGFNALHNNPVLYNELLELLRYLYERTDTVVYRPKLPFVCSLYVHARYTRDEILSALGHWTISRQPSMREGVKYLSAINTDLFLITLNKTDKDYSPTTMYEDYAISEDLFHWQSQSTTSEKSPTGQRYINHEIRGSTVLLFVREDKKSNNLSIPYYFLGPATYVSHDGSMPMSIIWSLEYPMPGKLIRTTERLAIA